MNESNYWVFYESNMAIQMAHYDAPHGYNVMNHGKVNKKQLLNFSIHDGTDDDDDDDYVGSNKHSNSINKKIH